MAARRRNVQRRHASRARGPTGVHPRGAQLRHRVRVAPPRRQVQRRATWLALGIGLGFGLGLGLGLAEAEA